MLRRATLRLGSIRSKLVGTVAKPAPELPLVAITNPNEKYVDFYPEDTSLPPTKHSLNNVIKDMEKSLHDYHDKTGFGRAVCAPMLGYHTRVIVAFLDHRYTTLINPRWSTLSVQKWSMWDNCCMFPDEVVRVARHVNGTMRYTTREGDTEEWLGLPFAISELLQHEFDHLDALTSLDRMSAVKLPEGHIFSRMPFVGKDGTLSRMPRVIFDKHRDECAKLVSPIYTADHIASAPSPHKISSHPD